MKILDTYNALDDMVREDIYNQLTDEQKTYIDHELVNGKKTLFANEILSLNMKVNNSENIDLAPNEYEVADWELVKFIDYGRGNALGRCYCNRKIVLECVIRNRETGREIVMGRSHLALFYGVGRDVFNKYFKSFINIDYERDELLVKFRDKAFKPLFYLRDNLQSEAVREAIESGRLEIPHDVQKHLELGLPLLATQEDRVTKQFKKAKLSNPFEKQPPLVQNGVNTSDDTASAIDDVMKRFSFDDVEDASVSEDMMNDLLLMQTAPKVTYVENGSFLDMYERGQTSLSVKEMQLQASEHMILDASDDSEWATSSTKGNTTAQKALTEEEKITKRMNERYANFFEDAEGRLSDKARHVLTRNTTHHVESVYLSEIAYELIKSGVSSLNELCEALTAKFGNRVRNGYYVTGKSKLYPDLALLLKERVKEGQLKEAIIGVYDVFYTVNPQYQPIEPIVEEDFPSSLFDLI